MLAALKVHRASSGSRGIGGILAGLEPMSWEEALDWVNSATLCFLEGLCGNLSAGVGESGQG